MFRAEYYYKGKQNVFPLEQLLRFFCKRRPITQKNNNNNNHLTSFWILTNPVVQMHIQEKLSLPRKLEIPGLAIFTKIHGIKINISHLILNAKRKNYPITKSQPLQCHRKLRDWSHLSRIKTNKKSNKNIKQTTGKIQPKVVSEPILKIRDQTTVKHHRFENVNFYKVLYGGLARVICHAKP